MFIDMPFLDNLNSGSYYRSSAFFITTQPLKN